MAPEPSWVIQMESAQRPQRGVLENLSLVREAISSRVGVG